MNDYERKVYNRIGELSQEGKFSTDFYVSTLKLCANYLNLKTIKEFADEVGKSPQGIRRYRKNNIIKIRNIQYIINNE